MCSKYGMVLMSSNAQVHKLDLFILQILVKYFSVEIYILKLGETQKYVNCSPCPQGAQSQWANTRNAGQPMQWERTCGKIAINGKSISRWASRVIQKVFVSYHTLLTEKIFYWLRNSQTSLVLEVAVEAWSRNSVIVTMETFSFFCGTFSPTLVSHAITQRVSMREQVRERTVNSFSVLTASHN